MSGLEAKAQYFLILADIAMAAAIRTHDAGYDFGTDSEAYVPGGLRSRWLTATGDGPLKQRVTSLASAVAAPMHGLSAERLVSAAGKYGIPLDPATAQGMADYFEARRNAVLTYNR